jgi:sortase A
MSKDDGTPPRKTNIDDLTLEELEALVEERRRIERARRFVENARGSRFRPITVMPDEPAREKTKPKEKSAGARWRERVLLVVEIAAVVGLIAIIVWSLGSLQTLNEEVAQAVAPGARSTTPVTAPVELPGSSFPPSDANLRELPGSSFPPNDLPAALGVNVEGVRLAPPPTPGPQSPTRIVIPAIGVDWPIVLGDGWEELKKGVGHRIGSANPGERGNLILSGHNDVYGEVFKDLEILGLNQDILVYAGSRAFRYVTRAKRVVVPTDLSILQSSRDPIVTLITCTPYRVDTHRLVVIGELAP